MSSEECEINYDGSMNDFDEEIVKIHQYFIMFQTHIKH